MQHCAPIRGLVPVCGDRSVRRYTRLRRMTEPNELYAYFTVSGDFDPAGISALVGVAPTESWVKGSTNPRTQRERRFSRWSLYSRLERSRELEAQIADVVGQLGATRTAS